MPSVTLHIILADRVLDRLRDSRRPTPFSPTDPIAVNAFRQGALGPDLGYFPGGHRPLSDLAHCIRAADLTRAMAHSARTPIERAFALGWATHVLADQRIHPFVGRGVRELRTGRADGFVSGESDQPGHVRVETGIDAWAAHRFGPRATTRAERVFDPGSIGFLRRAFLRIYGEAPAPTAFLRSHVVVVRSTGPALVLARTMGLGFRDGARGLPARWLRQALDAGCSTRPGPPRTRNLLLAYLTPVFPSAWLREAVEDEVEAFADRFLRVMESGLEALENRNLDTGEHETPGALHPGTLRALDLLERLRSAGRGAGPVPNPA